MLLLLIPLILLSRPRHNKSDYGHTKFASPKEIKEMGLLFKTGIILGQFKNQYLKLSDSQTVLCVSPPGTGKTASLIIPNIFSLKRSLIIHDIKGELHQTTANYRAKFSKILIFNPSDPKSVKFNPISSNDINDIDDFYRKVDRVASVIFSTANQKDRHWMDSANNLFCFVAYFLFDQGQSEVSISKVFNYINSSTDVEALIADCMDQECATEKTIQLGNQALQKGSEEFKSILSTFNTTLKVFNEKNVAEVMSSSAISAKDLRDNIVTLFITTKAVDVTRFKKITQLLIDEIVSYFLSENVNDSTNQVTLLLDEFPRMGRIQSLKDVAAISRGQKFNAVIVCQDFGQIEEVYGKPALESLLTNSFVKIIFTQNNDQTARHLSEMIGKKTITKQSSSKSKRPFEYGRNISESQEGRLLLLPQELMSLPNNQQIILIQGFYERPIKARKVFWFKDFNMKNLSH